MKKLLTLLLVLGIILVGCQKKQDSVEPAGVPLPESYLGYFYEKIAGRGILNVEKKDEEGKALITIDWGSSAAETARWEMEANYDGKDTLSYTNAHHSIRTYDTSGSYSEETVYENGTGTLKADGLTFIWHSDNDDYGQDVVFARDIDRKDDVVGMINPWIETTDLNVAIKNAGVEFEPPTIESLPTGDNKVMPFKFLSTFGTLSAYYESVNNEMIIRKSFENEGKEGLAGDYNDYPKTWTERYKSVDLNFAGDGKVANVVWFDKDGYHYAITFNPGVENSGLSLEEVTSMLDSMEQGKPVK